MRCLRSPESTRGVFTGILAGFDATRTVDDSFADDP
jgi:hypothetical protein